MHPHRTETTLLTGPSRRARRRVRQPLLCIGIVLAMLVWRQAAAAPNAASENGAGKGASYALTAWTGQAGLSLGDVFAITEDRDGYLWLGTSTGLVRFDGAVFTRRETGLQGTAAAGQAVSALLGARDGSIWIGHSGAGGIARITADAITRFGSDAGLPPGGIVAIREDRGGTIWAGGRGGLSAFRQGRWERVAGAADLEDAVVYSIYEDRDGQLWLGTSKGVYARTGHRFELRRAEATFVQDFAHGRDGRMWITDTTETIKLLATGEGPIHGAGALVPEGGWRMASDGDGTTWVAALGGGLMRLVEDGSGKAIIERFPYEHKIAGSPRAVFADRHENIWVGLRAGGLLRVARNYIHNHLPLEGLTNDGVRAIRATPDGSVWVATGHSLNRFVGARRDVYAVAQTRALEVDASGQLWIAAVHGFGRFEQGGLARSNVPSDVRWQEIMSVASHPSGAHWLCSSQQGVMVWQAGALRRFSDLPRLADSCSSIHLDSRGRPWVGFTAGGVALYDGGALRHFGEGNGLAAGPVLKILEDRADNIWVVTSSGISRFQDGRFTTITERNGPFAELTAALVQDDEGYLWLGAGAGAAILRFRPSEMDRVAADPSHEVQYTLYDGSDGLHGEIARQQGRSLAARAADGSLWFVSGTTIVMIDPRHLPPGQRPVAPRVDTVSADGKPIAAVPGLRWPAGVRNLAIGWTASSLNAASKLRFRYRLEGYDAEWVNAGSARQVAYGRLPSGDYRFKVSATSDGIWTDGESWAFSVARPFYLSGWFVALCAAGTIGLVATAWWLRVRAIRQRYVLVFNERALVSREIHDTLLQSLAAIGVELEAALRQLDPRQTVVVSTLHRLKRQSAHSLKEARDLVVALRRTQLSRAPGLIDTLRDIADHTTVARATSVRLTVEGTARRCSADVELQLLRICQEAINNAIAHGGATEIQIVVEFRDAEVALRVADDGRGFIVDFDAGTAADEEHLGLLGMQERAGRVRGRLVIASTPGSGTVVEVTVPAADR
ncbi:MAG: two-component regulator propeller domain-containing protein [Acidobacteriota bacterium]